jgi:hypothetical protein
MAIRIITIGSNIIIKADAKCLFAVALLSQNVSEVLDQHLISINQRLTDCLHAPCRPRQSYHTCMSRCVLHVPFLIKLNMMIRIDG